MADRADPLLPTDQEHATGSLVAVLRHDLWQEVFGGEREVLGRTVPYAVVGTFLLVVAGVAAWLPGRRATSLDPAAVLGGRS